MSDEVAYDVAVVAVKSAAYVSPTIGAARLAREVDVDPERAVAWGSVADAARV